MNELHTLIEQIFEEPLFDVPSGRIPYASAKLGNCVVNQVWGLENPFFFLGLLLSFSTICLTYPLEILLKFVILGMYCLTSPFMFSMPPFPKSNMDVQSKSWCPIPLRWFHVLQTPSRCRWLWSLQASRSLWVVFTTAWASGTARFPK